MPPTELGAAPTVLGAVGTDFHPFPRLVHWLDEWAAVHSDVHCFVQTGPVPLRSTSRLEWAHYLPAPALDDLARSATVLVCHGGAASVALAWQHQKVPIIVPRLKELGEAVDDHQLAFAGRLFGAGLGLVAQSFDDLSRHLERACASPMRLQRSSATEGTVRLFGELVGRLEPVLGPGATRRRRRTQWRLPPAFTARRATAGQLRSTRSGEGAARTLR
jgi:UDP-N-acetylglucosamine transferase subunit ALG13